MLEIIGAVLKIFQLLLGKWLESNAEKKQKVQEILKDVSQAKSPEHISVLFDRINRVR
jgi:hypothetical protein